MTNVTVVKREKVGSFSVTHTKDQDLGLLIKFNTPFYFECFYDDKDLGFEYVCADFNFFLKSGLHYTYPLQFSFVELWPKILKMKKGDIKNNLHIIENITLLVIPRYTTKLEEYVWVYEDDLVSLKYIDREGGSADIVFSGENLQESLDYLFE